MFGLYIQMYTALLVVWFTLPLATLQSERAKFSFQNMKPKLKFNLNRGVSIHPSTGGKFQRPRKGQVMDSSRPDQQRNPVAIERSSSLEPRSRGGSVEQRSRGGSLDRCDQAGMYVAPTLYHIPIPYAVVVVVAATAANKYTTYHTYTPDNTIICILLDGDD